MQSSALASLGGFYLFNAGCAEGEGRSMDEAPATTEAVPMANMLERIGLQLYTVRGLMRDDVAGTLKQVADVGYKEVEFAGYFDHSPADIKGMLDELGLVSPAVHVGYDLLRDSLDGVLEAAKTIGHQYIVCPWLTPEQRAMDAYRQHAVFFNEVGAACKAAGIQFTYHNHDFEFEEMDGVIPYDVLLEETDPERVQMELDLFWITKGGHDPLAYFARYPGRFPLCHVKDMTAAGDMVAVGEGTIDFAAIFKQSEQAGLIHYFVEHDNPGDAIQSIQTSYAHLKALHF